MYVTLVHMTLKGSHDVSAGLPHMLQHHPMLYHAVQDPIILYGARVSLILVYCPYVGCIHSLDWTTGLQHFYGYNTENGVVQLISVLIM